MSNLIRFTKYLSVGIIDLACECHIALIQRISDGACLVLWRTTMAITKENKQMLIDL